MSSSRCLNSNTRALWIFAFFCWSWCVIPRLNEIIGIPLATLEYDGFLGLKTDTSHETFSRHFHPCAHITLWLKVSQRVSHEKHVHPHVITCLSVCCFLVLSSSSVSRASTFSLTSTCSLSWTSTFMWSRPPSIKPNAHSQNEEYWPMSIHNPLTSTLVDQSAAYVTDLNVSRTFVVSYTLTIGLLFLFLFMKVSHDPHVCVVLDTLNFVNWRVVQRQCGDACLHFACCVSCSLVLVFFGTHSIASLSCVVTMATWIRRWNPVVATSRRIVEEWEQEVYASIYSDQEIEHHCRDPCPRVRDFIHPVQFGIFPNRLPFATSRRRDSIWLRRCLVRTRRVSEWVKVNRASTLERHLVS